MMTVCPDCSHALEGVYRERDSYLNAEQFDAVKAGDLFCRGCLTYWWDNGRRSAQTSRLADQLRAERATQAQALGAE